MNGWSAKDIPDQKGKIIIITGANSGVGYESALALARKGARVVMACRSKDKAERARQDILKLVPTAQLDVLALDLGSLKSIQEFAEIFTANYPRLDVLMNNAGIMSLPYAKTVDGFEQQFGTNHLGHFALTGQLLPKLLLTPHSRVVTVSSSAYMTGRMNFDNLQGEQNYQRWHAYEQSKLANILFALELQRKLKAAHAEVISLASHPGHAVTNLQTHGTTQLERLQSRFFNALTGQPAENGATYQLYAATTPNVQGGGFYGPKWILWGEVVKVEVNARGKDGADAARLWQISEQLTDVHYDGLRPSTPVLEKAPAM
jgi:NAD(P)-dependent dehydrogenase (short-subunit alcohol dehydrogenase family)